MQVFDRDLIASGAAYNVYRILRLRAELAPSPALSLERVTEHSSLLSLAATAAGVRTPASDRGPALRPGHRRAGLRGARQRRAGGPDRARQLDDLWRTPSAGCTPGTSPTAGSRPAQSSSTRTGWCAPHSVNGAMFAGDLRVSLDRVQLLITTAQLAGPERAVAAGARHLTDDDLAAVLPVLQPLALPSATRRAVKQHAGLLEALRDEIEKQTHAAAAGARQRRTDPAAHGPVDRRGARRRLPDRRPAELRRPGHRVRGRRRGSGCRSSSSPRR